MLIILILSLLLIFLVGFFIWFRAGISFVFFFIFIVILLVISGTFIVREGQQVVITQFGQIIGHPYKKPGLYLKIPFFWKATYFDKRLITDIEYRGRIPTKDSYFISIDVVYNWKIVNPIMFINNMRSEKIAQRLLKNIISGDVRQAVAELNLVETVRTKDLKSKPVMEGYPEILGKYRLGLKNKVVIGRENLAKRITKRVNKYVNKFGIIVPKIYILDIKYQNTVLKMIYNRMIQDRLREAERLRSEGRSEYESIIGQTKKSYNEIIAPAIKRSLEIIGKAHADEARIKANTFGKNVDFYNFWRTLNAYKNALPSGAQGAIFSTDAKFLQLLSTTNQDKDTGK